MIGLLRRLEALLYSKKEKRHQLVGPPKLWKMKQDFQINFVKEKGLKATDHFMDIGCGTLRGGIPIIRFLDEGHYYGIDVRENVIREGLKELDEEGLTDKSPNVECFESFDKLVYPVKFDMVWAFSVLIHLEDSICKACLAFVKRHLNEEGTFYANVNIGERPEGHWQGYPVMYKSLTFYEELAEKYQLRLENLGTLGELGHISGSKPGDSQIMLAFSHQAT